MSITLNADTSSGLVMTSDTSGEIKLQSAGADIATVDSSGITMASGKTLPAASLTGTLPAIDGSSLTNLPAPAALTTASGAAPSYSARAWVNFNGTGTVAIRASGNVTSITDNGTGDYTVNLTTAMADANYNVVGIGSSSSGNSWGLISLATSVQGGTDPTTTSFRVKTTNSNAGVVNDQPFANVSVFR